YGLLALRRCVQCFELTQPGSMVVRPGQSLTIDCKVSYSVTSYYSAWIRQPAGKALEWIGYISSGGGTAYNDKLKSKFSISRDTGTNTITLRGQNLQTEDTAVYYCARYTVTLTNEHGLQKPRADTQVLLPE
uniref:Ig-like domain-containing protein n=1 Tax=Pygocentrus nattereri TaxID=42514 RepID=A0AAR2IN34_PYGNA